jgi:hypothetical protein
MKQKISNVHDDKQMTNNQETWDNIVIAYHANLRIK